MKSMKLLGEMVRVRESKRVREGGRAGVRPVGVKGFVVGRLEKKTLQTRREKAAPKRIGKGAATSEDQG